MGSSHEEMEAHYEEIIEFSELRDFIDVPVKNFSSGMVSRLAFADCNNRYTGYSDL